MKAGYLRFGALATMHACDDAGSTVLLREVPQSLLGGTSLIFLLLDESSVTRLRVGIDLSLILLLDILRPVLEWQVILASVSDGADVKHVLAWAEKSLHCDGEGQLGGVSAINRSHIILTTLSGL